MEDLILAIHGVESTKRHSDASRNPENSGNPLDAGFRRHDEKLPLESPNLGKRKVRCKRDERMAEVSVRYMPIELSPPVDHKDKAPIPLWIVHVVEDNPPE